MLRNPARNVWVNLDRHDWIRSILADSEHDALA
jgi:hypothetical protein